MADADRAGALVRMGAVGPVRTCGPALLGALLRSGSRTGHYLAVSAD